MPTTSDIAVLFANLNADPLYQGMEESKALALVNGALDLLRSAVAAAGGRVVKTIGDEVMAEFPDAPQAAAAAIEMQRGFARQAAGWPEGSLTIGFAWGPVMQKDGDHFGDTVSVAANANSGPARKKPGTIVLDAAALQRLPAPLRGACTHLHTLTRPNRPPLEFYNLPW